MSRQWIIPAVLLPYIGCFSVLVYNMEVELEWAAVLLPVALGGIVLMARNFEAFLLLMVASVPFSMGVKDLGGGLGLSLPAEAMLLLAGLGGLLILIRQGLPFKGLLRHPIVVLVLVQHVWVLATSLNSSMNLISLKFFLIRSLFLSVYFLLFLHIFQKHRGGIRFIWAYLLGFLPVIIYSLIKLSKLGLARRFSPDMGEPFFDDHTIFGAAIAMVLPTAWMLFRRRKLYLTGMPGRKLAGIIFVACVAGLIFSFSRAAWMSVVFIGGFFLLLRLKIRFSYVVVGFFLVVAAGFIWQDALLERMRKNENVSGEDIVMMAKSVTNVSTDESNQERVNRWSCAVRMWQDRPGMGFGPGTYESQYPPYQLKAEKTRISSNEGDRGDAHSEYLTALSEQGLPGLLIFLVLIFTTIHTGMKLVYRSSDVFTRRLAQAILLGLMTFFVHGVVNSFLDLDEAATLFWGMMALLVALDLRGKSGREMVKNIKLEERRSAIEGT